MIPLRDNIRSKRVPFVNWVFIAANSYVFYLELKMGTSKALEGFVNRFAVVPAHLFSDPLGQAFHLATANFLHGGWMHLLSNMLFLFIFGDNVEDIMGHFRYFFFYLLVGAVANFGQAYVSPHSMIPVLGASASIAGVLGSYFFFFPHARIVTLIPIFIFFTIREVPAFLFLGLWFLLQTLNSVGTLSAELVSKQAMGGVAWWAHAIGFVAGLVMSPVFAKSKSKYR